ncbi:MAG: hypothetical protein K2L56_08785 [Prevotella sp.]|nr:hypothetical protein [Prevotella sp.]
MNYLAKLFPLVVVMRYKHTYNHASVSECKINQNKREKGKKNDKITKLIFFYDKNHRLSIILRIFDEVSSSPAGHNVRITETAT